ncbi:hypothetical protein [Labrenzia sp. VG12]|uniref:hypothetical protein n=1 Tax=Labrenzia sp. VG12 TaxID=2021862 RepID=UPI000B8C59D7|nr:hypothetical protein [Labrenzia sp. VG12]ASP36515.1 hypothetical protein CHH27_27420 [Labrenzia sp. VG12]
MIVVQVIHVQWSKSARGAPLARARNSVPERLPLDNEVSGEQEAFVLNYQAFSETNAFAAPVEVFTCDHEADQPVAYEACLLRPHALSIPMPHSTLSQKAACFSQCEVLGFSLSEETSLVVEDKTGRITRPTEVPTCLEVFCGEWGQIGYNRRFSVDAGTLYEKVVLNVAFLEKADSLVFLRSPPKQRRTSYERLL